ncbi:MAG: hypothetical protein ABI378_11160, partial [Chitinophagaceae bacterium]
MKNIYLLVFSLFFFVHAAFSQTNPPQAPGKEELGIDIKPTLFSFTLDKGEKGVKTVTIANGKTLPIQLAFYLGDWIRDSLGEHKYFPAGSQAKSCAPWVKLSRAFIEVPANGTASFDMTLTVPDSAKAVESMRWAMLFVEFVSETKAPKVTGNQVATNMIRKQ